MLSLVLVAGLVQAGPSCNAALTAAREAYVKLDVVQSDRLLQAAVKRRCAVGDVLTYLQALVAARAAYAAGGSAESLAVVRRAADTLAARNDSGGPLEIASFVLRAAAAASQSERGEMAAYLAQALQLERARGAAGKSLAPIASAHEVAAELWLQVHGYDEAAAAFLAARAASGDTLRTTLGLARALARGKKIAEACVEYRHFTMGAKALAPAALNQERLEAVLFVNRETCRAAVPPVR